MHHALTGIPGDFWAVLTEMSPYLLFGFFAAGALSVLVSANLVERHLGGRGLWAVIKAAAFGVPIPLCSCGVIPVAASLRRHGASRGATTAFLIATPQDGVDSVMVTLSLLGPAFAIFRPIAALASGILGGVLVNVAEGNGSAQPTSGPRCEDACCAPTRHGRLYRLFAYGFGALPRDIGKAVLVGLVLSALITALVPQDFLGQHVGHGIGAMLIMMLVGIPMYVCATASVPIAAALIVKGGITPGAALVFLMTGPATNAATIAMVWKVMGRRTALIYLASIAGTALAAGVVLDMIVTGGAIREQTTMLWMLPAPVQGVSAVVLLGVLGWAVLRPVILRRRAAPAGGPSLPKPVRRLHIRGMTCTHCAASVRQALLECPGVTSAEVDLDSGQAVVTGADVDLQALQAAVGSIGYEAVASDGDPAT